MAAIWLAAIIRTRENVPENIFLKLVTDLLVIFNIFETFFGKHFKTNFHE